MTPESLNLLNFSFPMPPTTFPDHQAPITAADIMPFTTNPPQMNQIQNELASTFVPSEVQVGAHSIDASSALNDFFLFFHASHPFLPPRFRLLEVLKEEHLPHLELAMQYVASVYKPSATIKPLGQSVDELLFCRTSHKDGFIVQAMLLFALGLHASGEQERAADVMQSAISIALDIAMHRREFASRNSAGCSIMEESWRRTWWELYIVNGMMAGTGKNLSFRLLDIATDVALPCEEHDFMTGVSLTHPDSAMSC